jgi:hypothetical protein
LALEGYTGWHGQGKTYTAVADVLGNFQRHGIPVVTNAIVAGSMSSGRWLDHGPYAPLPPVLHFETWDDLMGVITAAIDRRLRLQLLIDEAGKFLSSRFYSKLDPRVLMVLQERRKVGAGLDLYWTAPHFEHVDKILRDVTQVVHVCRRFGGSEYSHDGGRPPRAFYVRAYRPTDVTKAKRKAVSRRLVPFTSDLASLYTTGIVSMAKPMAAAVDAGPDFRGESPLEHESPTVRLEVAKPGRRKVRAR